MIRFNTCHLSVTCHLSPVTDSYDDRRGGGPRKRFDKYRVIGMMLLFFGIAILALGIFDVGWTVSRYGDNCQADNAAYPGLCAGNHVFVYVGSPLWGGALVSHVTLLRHLIDSVL